MYVRIVPSQHFTGTPAPRHRPYAFYADAYSLHGRSIADCFQIVQGNALPPGPGVLKFASPLGNHHHDWAVDGFFKAVDDPKGKVSFRLPSFDELLDESFVVLTSRGSAALDVFPATWRALSFIVSDPARMKATDLVWTVSPERYASARVHALFRDVHRQSGQGLLADRCTKESLGLNDGERIPTREEESPYYQYLSHDSGFTDEIVDLFGLNNRCWHGCGYIGYVGFPQCRTFLLRNVITADVQVRVMRGSDRFEPGAVDP